jgi:hypothetical protein
MSISPKLKFRASDAHRWTSCLASVREEARRPKDTSTFATDGIVFHAVIEPYIKALNPGPEPIGPLPILGDKITVDGEEHEVTEEHIENVGLCLSYIGMIIEQIPDKNFEIFVELKVEYGTWTVDGQYGYIDIVIIDRANRALHLLDTKYGKGIEVYAVKNAQLSLYALAAIQELGLFEGPFDSVEFHIMQPRRDHFDKWVTSEDELAAWGGETKATADRIIATDELPFNPSDKACRFCKAKSDCRALAENALSTVSAGFEDIVESFDAIDRRTDIKLIEIPPLTPEEIFNVYHNIDTVRVFLKAIEARAYAIYMSGEAPENNGCKLVKGKTNRVWKDEKKADAAIGRQKIDSKTRREPWKLRSPAQIEKIIGKDHKIMGEKYVDKPPGKPTLVPLSDKRPAINVAEEAAEGFVGAEEGDMLIESTNGETKTVTFSEPVETDIDVNIEYGEIITAEPGELTAPRHQTISAAEAAAATSDTPNVNNNLAVMDNDGGYRDSGVPNPGGFHVTGERGVEVIGEHFLDEAFDDSDYLAVKPVSLFDETPDNE